MRQPPSSLLLGWELKTLGISSKRPPTPPSHDLQAVEVEELWLRRACPAPQEAAVACEPLLRGALGP